MPGCLYASSRAEQSRAERSRGKRVPAKEKMEEVCVRGVSKSVCVVNILALS